MVLEIVDSIIAYRPECRVLIKDSSEEHAGGVSTVAPAYDFTVILTIPEENAIKVSMNTSFVISFKRELKIGGVNKELLPYKDVLWSVFQSATQEFTANKENLSTQFGPDNYLLFLKGTK